MRKIILERVVDLKNSLTKVTSISVDESINYKIENEGIRATGCLIVTGECVASEITTFKESIDLDVLATYDKIVDQRDFSIKVEDFNYKIVNGNLFVSIFAHVHGVTEGEDRYVSETSFENIDEVLQESSDEINALIIERDKQQISEVMEPVVEEPIEDELEENIEVVPLQESVQNEIVEKLEEVVYQTKTRPLFQDSSDSVGTYYLYIVKENDTYESISSYYNIDLNVLMDYNQQKRLDKGTVIIVPYVA